MAALLKTNLSPLLSKYPVLVNIHHASGFSTHLHPVATTVTVPHVRVMLMCVRKKFIQKRNFYSYFIKKTTPEQKREKDKVESHYDLVYNASSSTYIQLGLGGVQAAMGLACLTLGAGVCGFPLVQTAVITEQPLEVASFITVNLMICLGILRVCNWYPVRIYYSEVEDKFIAVFVGVHPLAVRHLKILPGEVKPIPPGYIKAVVAPWSHHLYSTPFQTIHLNTEHFRYPFYYNKLLGYMSESQ